jgi:hypothetical protein
LLPPSSPPSSPSSSPFLLSPTICLHDLTIQ